MSAAGEPDVPGTGACIGFMPGSTGLPPNERDGLANPTVEPIADEEWLAPPPRAKDDGADANVSTSGMATDIMTRHDLFHIDLLQFS